jgi:Trpc4-associated protein
VEVLFVLCTLLGGRRKIDVQRALGEQGLVEVLTVMFDRLSWGQQAPDSENPLEQVHGPGCECNPSSALRVQYLRVVHNFLDRDCMTRPGSHKHLLLSHEERLLLESDWDPREPLPQLPPSQRGLLTRIIDVGGTIHTHARAHRHTHSHTRTPHTQVLVVEPSDSVYRFWLASCVESFLRGSSDREQCFVAATGLLQHLAKEVTSMGLKCAGSLQVREWPSVAWRRKWYLTLYPSPPCRRPSTCSASSPRATCGC